MSQELSQLRKDRVLGFLTEAELATLLSHAERREFANGDLLLQEGIHGDSILLIASGKVQVMRGEVQIAMRQGPHILGEMVLFDPGIRSASAQAHSKGVLYELARPAVWTLLHQGNQAAVKLIQSLTVLMCERLDEINRLVQTEVAGPANKPGVFKGLFNRLFRKGRKE